MTSKCNINLQNIHVNKNHGKQQYAQHKLQKTIMVVSV